ncbi:hypothetical protein Catovirus_2_322 [Catovirus CTV1]|uniref:RNA ligase n=1 Tax=Catovirus CTV1 TaxID=1977631 RepID=A0A1V0SCD4_9VIRU|nr:hypothetical protein Catovirus_2_322 [Catovirus CTV1]
MFDSQNIDINDTLTMSDIVRNFTCKYSGEKLKEYLQYLFGGFILTSCLDETDELYLINTKLLSENLDYQNRFYSVIKRSPSIIIDKSDNCKIMIEYNNNINLPDTTIDYQWEDVKVSHIYPGLNIILFYYKNEWKISSDETLNMENEIINYDTLMNIMNYLKNKIDLNTLNKNSYYHFIYQTNKGKNHLDNRLSNNSDQTLLFVESYQMYEFTKSDEEILEITKIPELFFSCMDELTMRLDYMTYDSKINKCIYYAGFILKIYKNKRNTKNIYLYNEIYKFISENVSNNTNIHRVYLELYQKNNLSDILPYISDYSSEITHRLNMSMKTISREILNIYHTTRKKKHQELYKQLPESYKKILYGLHGVYINSKKKEIINRKPIEYDETKSITVHDVYYYVKELTSYQLIELFKERIQLLKNNNFEETMNHSCIYTLTQTKLMFDDEEN